MPVAAMVSLPALRMSPSAARRRSMSRILYVFVSKLDLPRQAQWPQGNTDQKD